MEPDTPWRYNVAELTRYIHCIYVQCLCTCIYLYIHVHVYYIMNVSNGTTFSL